MQLKIGALAKLAGCPAVTIRFYEKEGILGRTSRAQNNYRVYDEDDLRRLRFILHCRRHGIKLAEIRKLLVLKEHPEKECAYVHELVQAHLKEVDEQLQSLRELRSELEKLLGEEACGHQGHCAILQKLDASDGCKYCQDLAAQTSPRETTSQN